MKVGMCPMPMGSVNLAGAADLIREIDWQENQFRYFFEIIQGFDKVGAVIFIILPKNY